MSFIRSRIRWLDETVWFPPFSNPAVASLRPHYCCLLHNPRFACFLLSCRAELSSHNAHYMALACGLPLPPVHTQHRIYFGPGADPWGTWGSHRHDEAAPSPPGGPRPHGSAGGDLSSAKQATSYYKITPEMLQWWARDDRVRGEGWGTSKSSTHGESLPHKHWRVCQGQSETLTNVCWKADEHF